MLPEWRISERLRHSLVKLRDINILMVNECWACYHSLN